MQHWTSRPKMNLDIHASLPHLANLPEGCGVLSNEVSAE